MFSAIKRKKSLEEQAHGENRKIEFPTNAEYVTSPPSTDTPSIHSSLLKCSQFTINLPGSVNIRHTGHWQYLSEATIRLFPGSSSPDFTYPGGQRHPLMNDRVGTSPASPVDPHVGVIVCNTRAMPRPPKRGLTGYAGQLFPYC